VQKMLADYKDTGIAAFFKMSFGNLICKEDYW